MSEFDSIMVRVEVGGSRKFARFSPEERWCIVAGVWCLAAKSPVRGYLLIADSIPVEVKDVAVQAEVKLIVAKRTMEKMRQLGMLESDEEIGAEHVHDWHLHQKEPKPSESRDGWRERKRRQRERERHGDVTPDVTRDIRDTVTPVSRAMSRPLREEKGSEEKGRPPSPPGGGRRRDRQKWREEFTAWVQAHPPDLLVEEWEPVRLSIVEGMGEDRYGMYELSSLHPHAVVEGVWLLGGPERVVSSFRFYGESNGRKRSIGFEWEILDCKCELTREQAA